MSAAIFHAMEPIRFPNEIIEEILSKLCAKSAVRFKSVCKEWQRMISDPRFCRVHHEQRCLMLKKRRNKCMEICNKRRDEVIKIKINDDIICEVDPRVFAWNGHRCYCDGLLVLGSMQGEELLVVNPSTRKHTTIRGPCDGRRRRRYWDFSMYYDSRDADYKVARVDIDHDDRCSYRVYSCRNRSWGDEVRDLPFLPPVERWKTCSLDGRFYGLGDDEESIECFDARDGAVRRIPRPKHVQHEYYHYEVALVVLLKRLYFIVKECPIGYLLQQWEFSVQNSSWELITQDVKDYRVILWETDPDQFLHLENLYLP